MVGMVPVPVLKFVGTGTVENKKQFPDNLWNGTYRVTIVRLFVCYFHLTLMRGKNCGLEIKMLPMPEKKYKEKILFKNIFKIQNCLRVKEPIKTLMRSRIRFIAVTVLFRQYLYVYLLQRCTRNRMLVCVCVRFRCEYFRVNTKDPWTLFNNKHRLKSNALI